MMTLQEITQEELLHVNGRLQSFFLADYTELISHYTLASEVRRRSDE